MQYENTVALPLVLIHVHVWEDEDDSIYIVQCHQYLSYRGYLNCYMNNQIIPK